MADFSVTEEEPVRPGQTDSLQESTGKDRKNGSPSGGKDRRFIFGPGTIAAVVVIVALLLAAGVLQSGDETAEASSETQTVSTEQQVRTVEDAAFSAAETEAAGLSE